MTIERWLKVTVGISKQLLKKFQCVNKSVFDSEKQAIYRIRQMRAAHLPLTVQFYISMLSIKTLHKIEHPRKNIFNLKSQGGPRIKPVPDIRGFRTL